MKRLIAAILAAVLLCGCRAAPKRFSSQFFDVFDTVTELTVYCESQDEFYRILRICHDELIRLNGIFDIYGDSGESAAAALNSGALSDCPSELYELVESGIEWYDLSGGKLNIAMGSVLSLWHDCREKGVLPDGGELSTRAGHCDIKNIVLDGETVALGDSDMSLDFGAIAKGYAAEKAAELIEDTFSGSFALNIGGNVVTRGEKPSGKWEIGIEDPNGGILTTVKAAGECVVTSGDYQRYFEYGGKRYHHIIDPETLYPAEKWRSVTVIAGDSSVADPLSTALFLLDESDGRELLKKFGAEALWVAPDGEVIRTEGFSEYEK